MTKDKIGFYMVALVAAVMLLTGTFKIVGAEDAAAEFGSTNVPYILAIIEFLTAILILTPKTRFLGIIMAASYFGGAIAFAWLNEGETPIVQMGINAVLYIGAALYHPALQGGKGAGFAKP
ncbi:hypothetical protein CEQ90_02425 [Lewinellaceae bacterium SD302]|nr:hypothetical protein CEQ90_02425 [Lewinellaceae bacterium SD302]